MIDNREGVDPFPTPGALPALTCRHVPRLSTALLVEVCVATASAELETRPGALTAAGIAQARSLRADERPAGPGGVWPERGSGRLSSEDTVRCFPANTSERMLRQFCGEVFGPHGVRTRVLVAS